MRLPPLTKRIRSMHLVLAGPDEHGLIPDLLQRLSGAVGHVHAIGAIHGGDKWAS